jgi:hypothetical protein
MKLIDIIMGATLLVGLAVIMMICASELHRAYF